MEMVLCTGKKTYKFLFYLIVVFITLQMISDVTAGKIVSLLGLPVSVTVLYFPLTFVISDVLTEVYGYACARRCLWIVMAASITASLIYRFIAYLPSPAFFDGWSAYDRVFGIMPRILLGGWIAVFAGESSNNYVLARLKIVTKGRFLWTRTIGSTVVGQGVNTALFYVIGLYGVLPIDALWEAVLAGWVFKVCVEAACTPLVYGAVRYLKKAEREDHFDRGTDFNPLLF